MPIQRTHSTPVRRAIVKAITPNASSAMRRRRIMASGMVGGESSGLRVGVGDVDDHAK